LVIDLIINLPISLIKRELKKKINNILFPGPTLYFIMFARPTRYSDAGRAIINKLKQAGPGPVSTETLTKMSLALSGKNNPMFSRKHSEGTLALMSEAFSSVNNPMFGRTHSTETLAKMSSAQGTAIYVYSPDKSTLINTFSSANKAAEFFN
jgi:hypothetical protein